MITSILEIMPLAVWKWIVGGLSLIITLAVLLVRRRERASLLILLTGPLMGLMAAGSLGWESMDSWALASVVFLAVAAIGYGAGRSRLFSFSQAASLILGGMAIVGSLFTLIVMSKVREGDIWFIFSLPLGLIWSFLICGLIHLFRRALAQPGAQPVASGEEQKLAEKKMILDMLARDKISAAEATELLDAIGREDTPADRLPLTSGIIASLAGGVVIVTGWVMPWSYMPLQMLMRYPGMDVMEEATVYFAGYHLGLHGWLIPILGVVPAILACIPALDVHLRQGMLRLFMALIGTAFTVALLSMSLRQGAPSVGPIMSLFGFIIQVTGALSESRLIRSRTASGEGAD